jgi:hypothetical protein
MMKVDLSIDWDFFIREKPEWDFGHKESLLFILPNPVWLVRYAKWDLVKETDIRKFADFHPSEVLREFEKKGLKMRGAELYVAESHVFIVEAFKRRCPGRVLINLDAHYDLYVPAGDYVTCENWGSYFLDKDYYEKMIFVLPRWKEGWEKSEFRRRASKTHKIICYPSWEDLPRGNYEVRRIFVCRSGAWCPPHHDEEFVELCLRLQEVCRESRLCVSGGINPLEPREVDWEKVEQLRRAFENEVQKG